MDLVFRDVSNGEDMMEVIKKNNTAQLLQLITNSVIDLMNKDTLANDDTEIMGSLIAVCLSRIKFNKAITATPQTTLAANWRSIITKQAKFSATQSSE